MKTYSYTFDGTGTDTFTVRGGNFLELVSTVAVVNVSLFKNNTTMDEEAVGVEQGFRVKFTPEKGDDQSFDYAQITSATAQTVKVAVSAGEGEIGKVFGAVDSTDVIPTQTVPKTDVAVATGAVQVLLLAANTNRVETLISALAANTETLRVSGTGVAANKGTPVAPGQEITIRSTDAIYAFPGAVTNTFAITEISK